MFVFWAFAFEVWKNANMTKNKLLQIHGYQKHRFLCWFQNYCNLINKKAFNIPFWKTFNENARKSNILLNKKIVFCLISINLRYESYQVFNIEAPYCMSTGIMLEHVSYRQLFISIIKNNHAYFVTKFKFPVCDFIPNKIFEEHFLEVIALGGRLKKHRHTRIFWIIL